MQIEVGKAPAHLCEEQVRGGLGDGVDAGTPPGRWLGSGVAALGHGELAPGAQVSEAQLQLLVGMGRDPIAGVPLGRAYPVYSSTADRVAVRVAQLDPALGLIERGRAVADAGTQALIAQAHYEAVAAVIAFMEREVAATRTGATAGDGAVAQVDVTGLIATAFDHFDSRAGDPHLHTHVVISNKVRTVLDGKWRSLDGRPMHAAVVALSELHEAVFADHMTRTFGVSWEPREMGRDRNPSWAITDVPEQLVAEFSTRSRHINEATDALIADYVTQHGKRPSPATIMKLRARATLATRPEKQVRSLAELTEQWRTRASQQLGVDATVWARTVTGGERQLLLRADDVPLDLIEQVGRSVVEVVGEKRSTRRRWNLMAEAARQTMGWRFSTVEDREAITAMVADAAEQASLRLTPPELATSPVEFRRPDGTSVFRPKHSTVFSSDTLLAAEDRLLQRARTTTGPSIDLTTVEAITSKPDAEGRMLGPDQAAALVSVAVSGRLVDVLVGPGGGREDDRHECAAPGVGNRAWCRVGSRAGPLGGGGASAGRRSGDRHGEYGEVVDHPPTHRRDLPGQAAGHHRRSLPRRHPLLGPDHSGS